MFIHELYTGTIPGGLTADGTTQTRVAIANPQQNTGLKQFDRSGELPGRFAFGTLGKAGKNIIPGPGSGHGYLGFSGATHCGEEVR